jgi:glutamate N-acetyltransferase/amino-acid N-acetyltransferase
MTTDLYPKLRRADVPGPGGGSIVGIAKGAGMIEPNLATMLVYVMTDVAVPRARLRAMLARVADDTFNSISVDSDTSTSDTVVALSSGAVPCADEGAFEAALRQVCAALAADVVRNGEGVHHVVRVRVAGAPTNAAARAIGKAVVNAPLVKTAICGNDPNVGRIVAAIGKHLGALGGRVDATAVTLTLGGERIFERGAFRLDPRKEAALVAHLREAELYASVAAPDGVYRPPVDYPPHERAVELEVDLGAGPGVAEVLGADLSHEYISENADYRS